MIQFPPSPTIGQIFAPLPGVSYKFDGIGWGLNLSGTPTGDITVIGKIQVSGQGLFGDGTAAAPGISWTGDPDSGWFRTALGTAVYGIDTVTKFAIGYNGVQIFVPTAFPDGVLNAPSITFLNAGNVGFYRELVSGNIAMSYGANKAFEGGNHFTVYTGMTVVGALNAASMSSTTISGNLSVTGQTSLGSLNVVGATTLAGVNTGNLTVNGNLSAMAGTTNLGATGVSGNLYVNGNLNTSGGAGFPTLDVTGRITGHEHIVTTLAVFAHDYNFHVPGGTDFHYDGGVSIFHKVSGVDCWYTNSGGHVILVPLTVQTSSAFNGLVSVNSRLNLTYNGSGAATGYSVASILINSTAGGNPSLGFHQAGVAGWNVVSIGHLYTGEGSGPAGLSGFSFAISKSNGVYAFYYNVISSLLTASAPMTGSLGNILKLRGVRGIDAETGRPAVRVELDGLEREFPELVDEIETNGVIGKGINYMGLAAPIIEAIRELNNRVTALEGDSK